MPWGQTTLWGSNKIACMLVTVNFSILYDRNIFLIKVVVVTLNPDLWHIIAIHCTLFIHSSSEEEDQNSYVHKELAIDNSSRSNCFVHRVIKQPKECLRDVGLNTHA